MLTEYSIKVAGDTGEFLVTKHEDGEPTHTYIVGAKNTNCSCPGSTHHKVQCKHMQVVKHFKALGRPKDGLYRYSKYRRNNIGLAEPVQWYNVEEAVL